jgi:hypothetical protein
MSLNNLRINYIETETGWKNNGNAKKLRNRICVSYIERTSVGNTLLFVYTL